MVQKKKNTRKKSSNVFKPGLSAASEHFTPFSFSSYPNMVTKTNLSILFSSPVSLGFLPWKNSIPAVISSEL